MGILQKVVFPPKKLGARLTKSGKTELVIIVEYQRKARRLVKERSLVGGEVKEI